jgi:hypothetical protein
MLMKKFKKMLIEISHLASWYNSAALFKLLKVRQISKYGCHYKKGCKLEAEGCMSLILRVTVYVINKILIFVILNFIVENMLYIL